MRKVVPCAFSVAIFSMMAMSGPTTVVPL